LEFNEGITQLIVVNFALDILKKRQVQKHLSVPTLRVRVNYSFQSRLWLSNFDTVTRVKCFDMARVCR